MNQHKLATHLHALGLSVIPVRNKVPQIKWKQYQTERCTADKLDEWFDGDGDYACTGNCVAIVTGAISGIVAVDCDTLDNWRTDTDVHQRTLRGRHFIYRHPGGVVPNRTGIAPNVDIRGDGGYICAYIESIKWCADELEAMPVYKCEAGTGVAEAATSYRVHGRKAKQLATVLRIPKAARREIAALVDQLAE